MKRPNEKLIYLADDNGSILTLKELIDDIRNDRLKNFVIVAQSAIHKDTVITRGPEAVDGERPDNVIKYYFFGQDQSSYHLGLCLRMAHLINQYMDGVDIFNEFEVEGE